MELLRQSRTNARDEEHELTLKLQAAQEEIEELKRGAMTNKERFQKFDEALEVEEAKTNDERLARREAEETSRQHRAELSKAKRKEAIANEHCDAAEAEILNLKRDLSSERSAVVGFVKTLVLLNLTRKWLMNNLLPLGLRFPHYKKILGLQ